ncbi:MAG TPA: LysR family transcriptional regulator, partial [Eoetvoesiella sp.]
MKSALTINELEAFIQVADTRNFRVAAERSFISQPALSRRIQSAESKLDTRLLDRNTRQVDLTPAGKELLPIAKRIVYEFNDSLSELSEFITGRKGKVVVACLPSLAASILPRVMVVFRERHPRVSIVLKPIDATSI